MSFYSSLDPNGLSYLTWVCITRTYTALNIHPFLLSCHCSLFCRICERVVSLETENLFLLQFPSLEY